MKHFPLQYDLMQCGENYFVAFARVLNPRVYGHVIQPNQKFKAVTVVSDKTLLNLIFHGD
jgi:hypothetical protein